MPSDREKITFLCDPETREYLEQWAEDDSRSLSNLVELIVKRAIDTRKSGTGKRNCPH